MVTIVLSDPVIIIRTIRNRWYARILTCDAPLSKKVKPASSISLHIASKHHAKWELQAERGATGQRIVAKVRLKPPKPPHHRPAPHIPRVRGMHPGTAENQPHTPQACLVAAVEADGNRGCAR